MAKSGGRIAKRVTKEELTERIFKEIQSDGEYDDGFDIDQLWRKIAKDVSKISFDFENSSFMKEEGHNENCDDSEDFEEYDNFSKKEEKSEYEIFENYDIHTLENGLTYCLCGAGGDWEEPVYFIVYIDNKNKIRGYIPTEGNTFNVKYKCAYGSEENCENYEEDEENENYEEDEENENYEEDEENENDEENYPELDMEKFNADILGRISVI